MTNTLVSPADLADFPGAPFPDPIVDAAAQAIRDEVGWHVAPLQPETLVVSHGGGDRLLLPTLRIESVTEVRDVSGAAPVVLTGWRKLSIGALQRSTWPIGDDVVEVELQHGFAATPDSILTLAARLCQAAQMDITVQQEAAQPFMVIRSQLSQIRSNTDEDPVLDWYSARLP